MHAQSTWHLKRLAATMRASIVEHPMKHSQRCKHKALDEILGDPESKQLWITQGSTQRSRHKTQSTKRWAQNTKHKTPELNRGRNAGPKHNTDTWGEPWWTREQTLKSKTQGTRRNPRQPREQHWRALTEAQTEAAEKQHNAQGTRRNQRLNANTNHKAHKPEEIIGRPRRSSQSGACWKAVTKKRAQNAEHKEPGESSTIPGDSQLRADLLIVQEEVGREDKGYQL